MAIEEFLKGLQKNPNNATMRKNISAAFARQGRFKEALEHAREAARLDPEDPQVHRNLARILDAVGKRDGEEGVGTMLQSASLFQLKKKSKYTFASSFSLHCVHSLHARGIGNTRDSLHHNREALARGPGCRTGGRVRDKWDTDTYRVVARQTVARHE